MGLFHASEPLPHQYERLVGKQLGGVRRKSDPHAVPHNRNSTC